MGTSKVKFGDRLLAFASMFMLRLDSVCGCEWTPAKPAGKQAVLEQVAQPTDILVLHTAQKSEWGALALTLARQKLWQQYQASKQLLQRDVLNVVFFLIATKRTLLECSFRYPQNVHFLSAPFDTLFEVVCCCCCCFGHLCCFCCRSISTAVRNVLGAAYLGCGAACTQRAEHEVEFFCLTCPVDGVGERASTPSL